MVKVLVVDDSSFIRRAITSSLETDPDIHVVGEAGDGQQAMALVEQLHPDVITMDLNMPNMDGITAIRQIRKHHSVPILVFTSASDRDGPKVLEALNAGAMDFVSKDSSDSREGHDKIIKKLRTHVMALAAPGPAPAIKTPVSNMPTLKPAALTSTHLTELPDYNIVVIGASTGGPVVIEDILKKMAADFPLPVLVVQHMPAGFTRAFAERLDELCSLDVIEAGDGMAIRPGKVYLAPGGRQMEISKNGSGKLIRITDLAGHVHYKPSVDVTFSSVAGIYGGKVLAIILTGMGTDGCLGAKLLKQQGATIWAQDRGTSVVYGMPMAIINNKLADKVLSSADIGTRLARVH